MLQADVEWRAEKRPNDIMQADLLHSLPAGAWRAVGVHQTADEALPVLWIQLSLWRPNEYDVHEYEKLVCYFMEHLSKQGPGFIVLFDMSGWKISFSLQVAKLKVLVGTLQNHYPERLRAALIIHTPGFFQATWRMMKPWLDPHTVEKVHFINGKGDSVTNLLTPYLGQEVLPQCYGGCAKADLCPGIPTEDNIILA